LTTLHDPFQRHPAGLLVERDAARRHASRRASSRPARILYGAKGISGRHRQPGDARFHLARMKAVGAFSVKSYNQPRRDSASRVIAAAREDSA
jgi:hypothetical protein